jgi:hypothetical protein
VDRGSGRRPRLARVTGLGMEGRFLMLVKTYPAPSKTYEEVVCCAGLDADTRKWIRMYPVNFRTLDQLATFKKWQFIEGTWGFPKRDNRPESRRIDQATIRAGEFMPAGKAGWRERRKWLDPVVDQSLEALREDQPDTRRSLCVIRPRIVKRLIIRDALGWDDLARDNAQQLSLDLTGSRQPPAELEIIPFDFLYEFECHDDRCRGHKMETFDWEAGAAYRRFRREYGDPGWRQAFRDKWERDLPAADLHLVVGTHSAHPKTWMIVGVLYPPNMQVDKGDGRSLRKGHREERSMTLPGFSLEAKQGHRLVAY